MCHQSVGLIARDLEANAIATVSMTSAWSVTASVKPPRSAFLDFPLGHTTGRPRHVDEQHTIVRDALTLFESVRESGTIMPLDYRWPAQWKESERNLSGDSPRRTQTPQYQCEEDRLLAIGRYGEALALGASDPASIPRD